MESSLPRKIYPADLAANLIFTPAVIYPGYRPAQKFDQVVMTVDKIRHLGIMLIPLVVFTVSFLIVRRNYRQKSEDGGK